MDMARGVEDGPPGPLTPRQAEVLAYLYETTRDTGIQPSCAEVAARFGLANRTGVECHLAALERKGWLLRPGHGRGRAFVLLRKPDGATFRGFSDKQDNE
jgi:SOS-response transcriptional repressor LexA